MRRLIFVIFCVLAIPIRVLQGQEFVGKICIYREFSNGKFANCSDLGLLTIPREIDNDSTVLDLSNNLIYEVSSKIFAGLPLLEQLNISSNNISILKENAFQGLNKLTVLKLSTNKLLVSTNIFNPGLFGPLENLQELYLDNNTVDQNSTYLDEAIGHCLNLKVLHIPGIYNKTFGSGYTRLTSLTKLSLSSDNCDMKIVQNNTFINTLHIRTLNISHCNIRHVDMCSFCNLSQLDELDMSYNSRNGLKLIRNISYGLQFTKTSTAFFTNMESPFDASKILTKYNLEFANKTSVKRLFVAGNMIESFETGAFQYLPDGLELIDMSDNRPILGPYIAMIMRLKNLKVVIADDLNQYHHFKAKTKRDIHKLGSFQNDGKMCVKLPPKLEKLYCRRSRIQYDIAEMNFCPDNELRHVELKHNALSHWKGPVRGLNKLVFADLSYNLCEKINEKFFINLTSLNSIDLTANFIGYVIEADRDCKWLKPLINLVKLKLNLNKIRILPPKCLATLVNLEILDLKDNFLSDWEVDIRHMPNLSVINLHGNGIDGFPKETTDHLSEVSKRHNVTINLTKNKLECTCEHIEFLEWLDTANIVFVGKENYTCKNKHLKELQLSDLKYIIGNLKLECADYSYLNTVLSVMICCFMLVVFYGIYYRYRWKISYFYHTTLGRYGLGQDAIKEKYYYDAYVSYGEEDRSFVEGKLAMKLENLYGLSLYLFERNGEPNRLINTTIVENIGRSRKVILILTKSYIKDKRCLFEINMTFSNRMCRKNAEGMIVLVHLEPVAYKNIPEEIRTLFNEDLYIEYPHDPEDHDKFWNRLKEAIKPSTDETAL